ncbi:ROK family transcriptional regulator [Naasia sp. SYSU D00057]|uniref:ROK family transcriptional regulator n=1 Tax=Naasia sp. SYSU D00057 TaxID=2817380 RepID=UPI001B3179A5|nr:ROK family transcriptional regulator [Naasia sp. SYSU D00057]
MTTTQLARVNREKVLRCLWEQGALTRIGIGRATSLAPATVNRLIASLMEAGLVSGAGSQSEARGRPALLVEVNWTSSSLLAVDVADFSTDLALVDLAGHVIESRRVPAERIAGDGRVAEVLDLIDEALGDYERRGVRIRGVGISVPGAVDGSGSVTVAPSVDWFGVPLQARVQGRTAVPVVVENDANLIAVAAFRGGWHRRVRSLVAIAVFSGVGSGIVEDGRLLRGAAGAAGQLGRMLRGTESLGQAYEGFGDIDKRLGIGAFAERARRLGIASDAEPVPLAADRLLQRAAAADPAARAALEDLFDEYALALVNVCSLLAPEAILLAGFFERWSDHVIPELVARIRPHVIEMPTLAPVAVPSATLVGAAFQAFDVAGGVSSLLEESDNDADSSLVAVEERLIESA